jgi:hypothetical protein
MRSFGRCWLPSLLSRTSDGKFVDLYRLANLTGLATGLVAHQRLKEPWEANSGPTHYTLSGPFREPAIESPV